MTNERTDEQTGEQTNLLSFARENLKISEQLLNELLKYQIVYWNTKKRNGKEANRQKMNHMLNQGSNQDV